MFFKRQLEVIKHSVTRFYKCLVSSPLSQWYHLAILGRENSLWVTKGTLQILCKSQIFPIHGLAGVVKNNFSTSGEAASGEIIFYHNC